MPDDDTNQNPEEQNPEEKQPGEQQPDQEDPSKPLRTKEEQEKDKEKEPDDDKQPDEKQDPEKKTEGYEMPVAEKRPQHVPEKFWTREEKDQEKGRLNIEALLKSHADFEAKARSGPSPDGEIAKKYTAEEYAGKTGLAENLKDLLVDGQKPTDDKGVAMILESLRKVGLDPKFAGAVMTDYLTTLHKDFEWTKEKSEAEYSQLGKNWQALVGAARGKLENMALNGELSDADLEYAGQHFRDHRFVRIFNRLMESFGARVVPSIPASGADEKAHTREDVQQKLNEATAAILNSQEGSKEWHAAKKEHAKAMALSRAMDKYEEQGRRTA